jgi:transposase
MDMTVFDDNYQNDETGRSAYNPKILLKVVLLAYSQGLTSSRQIERACCENVLFMAMSCNQRPDHSTIAPFVSSMKDQINRCLQIYCWCVIKRVFWVGAFSSLMAAKWRPMLPKNGVVK